MPSILNSRACFINHSAGLINCASPFGNSQSEQCIFNAFSLDFHFVIFLYAKVRPHLALTRSLSLCLLLLSVLGVLLWLVCYFTPNLNFFVCQHFLYPLQPLQPSLLLLLALLTYFEPVLRGCCEKALLLPLPWQRVRWQRQRLRLITWQFKCQRGCATLRPLSLPPFPIALARSAHISHSSANCRMQRRAPSAAYQFVVQPFSAVPSGCSCSCVRTNWYRN